MLKRWLKLLGKILLALIVLLVAFLLVERFRGADCVCTFVFKQVKRWPTSPMTDISTHPYLAAVSYQPPPLIP